MNSCNSSTCSRFLCYFLGSKSLLHQQLGYFLHDQVFGEFHRCLEQHFCSLLTVVHFGKCSFSHLFAKIYYCIGVVFQCAQLAFCYFQFLGRLLLPCGYVVVVSLLLRHEERFFCLLLRSAGSNGLLYQFFLTAFKLLIILRCRFQFYSQRFQFGIVRVGSTKEGTLCGCQSQITGCTHKFSSFVRTFYTVFPKFLVSAGFPLHVYHFLDVLCILLGSGLGILIEITQLFQHERHLLRAHAFGPYRVNVAKISAQLVFVQAVSIFRQRNKGINSFLHCTLVNHSAKS